jgi:hypothetical protein
MRIDPCPSGMLSHLFLQPPTLRAKLIEPIAVLGLQVAFPPLPTPSSSSLHRLRPLSHHHSIKYSTFLLRLSYSLYLIPFRATIASPRLTSASRYSPYLRPPPCFTSDLFHPSHNDVHVEWHTFSFLIASAGYRRWQGRSGLCHPPGNRQEHRRVTLPPPPYLTALIREVLYLKVMLQIVTTRSLLTRFQSVRSRQVC